MSTAGRPTFVAAIGRATNTTIQTRAVCGKDQLGHTKLKFRQIGQASIQELKQRDLREELEKKEHKYVLENDKTTAWQAKEELNQPPPTKPTSTLLIKDTAVENNTASEINVEALRKYDDSDVEEGEEEEDDGFDSSSEEDDDDDDDDEDDEDELQAELERIREEKAAAAAKKVQEEKELEEKLRRDSALRSNPLVHAEDATAKVCNVISLTFHRFCYAHIVMYDMDL